MRNNILLTILLLIALIIRIFAVLTFPQSAPDSGDYLSLAHSLVDNHVFSYNGITPTDHRAPLYPFFMASIFFFRPDSLVSVRIMQALLDVVTCFFIFLIAYTLWKRYRLALLATAIAAIHPALVGSTTFILSETLATHLLTCSIALLILSIEKRNKLFFALSGVLLGMNALCRPVSFPYPFFIAFLIILITLNHKKRDLIAGSFILITSFSFVISPWIIRNYYHFDKFIPVSSNFGESLWAGSYVPWDGHYNPEIQSIRKKTRTIVGSDKTGYYHVDDYLKKEAIDRIKQDPRAYTRLCLKKALRFWISIPGKNAVLANKVFLKNLIYIAHFVLLFFFIASLLILSLKKGFSITNITALSSIFYFTFIHAALVALPRYRIPIIPIVIIFASYAMMHLWGQLMKSQAPRS